MIRGCLLEANKPDDRHAISDTSVRRGRLHHVFGSLPLACGTDELCAAALPTGIDTVVKPGLRPRRCHRASRRAPGLRCCRCGSFATSTSPSCWPGADGSAVAVPLDVDRSAAPSPDSRIARVAPELPGLRLRRALLDQAPRLSQSGRPRHSRPSIPDGSRRPLWWRPLTRDASRMTGTTLQLDVQPFWFPRSRAGSSVVARARLHGSATSTRLGVAQSSRHPSHRCAIAAAGAPSGDGLRDDRQREHVRFDAVDWTTRDAPPDSRAEPSPPRGPEVAVAGRDQSPDRTGCHEICTADFPIRLAGVEAPELGKRAGSRRTKTWWTRRRNHCGATTRFGGRAPLDPATPLDATTQSVRLRGGRRRGPQRHRALGAVPPAEDQRRPVRRTPAQGSGPQPTSHLRRRRRPRACAATRGENVQRSHRAEGTRAGR